jgi:hypothetical protein
MVSRLFAVCVAFALLVPAAVQAKTKSDINFSFPTDKPVKIVVFRPDVQVGSLGVGGLESPNADWTADGRKNLAAALEKDQAGFAHQLTFMGDKQGAEGQTVAEYQSLFRAVSGAIFQHKFFGPKLPTKKDKFDWTLGPEAKKLADISGANYALMLYTHDSYGSAGRKAMQIVALLAFGAVVQAGIHQSYASLVDLETGKVVWFNVKLGATGDPREAEGAQLRITSLLETMPGRANAPVAKK